MIENRYRLKDYIITEYNNLFYTWEMNIILGEHRAGNCFIIGDILVIHSSYYKKDGCLKIIYYEKISRLPVWTKTPYYCFSHSLKNVNTGKNLSNYFTQAKIEKEKYCIDNKIIDQKYKYQLGQHKIITQSEGTISWEKYDRLNKINSGLCIIKSGILFIGPKLKETDETRSKREWFRELKLLQKWDKTLLWGYQTVLHHCHSYQEMKKSESVAVKLKSIKSYINSHKTVSNGHKRERQKKTQPYVQKLKSLVIFFNWIKGWFVITKPKAIKIFKFGSHIVLSLLKKIMDHKMFFLSISLFISTFFFLSSLPAYACDHHKQKEWSNKIVDNFDGDKDHHQKRKREHHRDNDHHARSIQSVKNTIYQEKCGGCHLAYQPELMPSASWKTLMKNLDGHFGETIELDDDSIKTIGDYLNANSAENSRTKRGAKIIKSLKNKKPVRITEIPYISHEHHEISPSVFNRESIGSFSNCVACHTTAEDGIYDDDNVRIPQ